MVFNSKLFHRAFSKIPDKPYILRVIIKQFQINLTIFVGEQVAQADKIPHLLREWRGNHFGFFEDIKYIPISGRITELFHRDYLITNVDAGIDKAEHHHRNAILMDFALQKSIFFRQDLLYILEIPLKVIEQLYFFHFAMSSFGERSNTVVDTV